jgi:2-hydroxymuconate-semialdehyde hydrolase
MADLTADLETHLTTSGDEDGDPLLLLHGTGPGASGQGAFGRLLPELSRFRCLVPDLIGFGDSAHPVDAAPGPGPWLELRVAAVRRLLDAQRVEHTHLLGHSYGCRVALELLKLEPERFGSAILVAAGGTPVKAELHRLTGFYDDPTPGRMRETVLAQLGRGDVPWFDDYVAQRFEIARRADVQRSFEAAMGPGEPAPVNDGSVLTTFDHPVLAVHGKLDATIPSEASLYLSEHLPHCDLHLFAGAGHQVQLELPSELATIVDAFVRAPALSRRT